MSDNLKIWSALGKTDPKHTKKFSRAGGFKGTSVKPIYMTLRMTEQFGPAGKGWGMGEPSFQTVPGHNHEVLVYCTVAVWWRDGDEQRVVHGVGGDKVVTYIKANQQYGRPERWENDDEAFKKAYTDALSNAMKQIGMAADVHMGQHDDDKYVQSVAQEMAAQDQPKTFHGKLSDDFAADRKAHQKEPEQPLEDWKAHGYTKTGAAAELRELGRAVRGSTTEDELDQHLKDHQKLITAVMKCSTWWDDAEKVIQDHRDELRRYEAEGVSPEKAMAAG